MMWPSEHGFKGPLKRPVDGRTLERDGLSHGRLVEGRHGPGSYGGIIPEEERRKREYRQDDPE